MKTTFINLTPHTINLNDGRSFPPSGTVARVSSTHTEFDSAGCCKAVFGDVTGLPTKQEGVILIVSGMVASAVAALPVYGVIRDDVVSPATGHPDCRRENGQVVSVPGFIRAV